MMKSIAIIESEQDTDYNNIARSYNSSEKDAVTLWRLGYDSLLSTLEPIGDKSILDYGCGSGTFSRYLSEKKARVTGVDISETMIKVAKESQAANIRYYQITSGNLDFLKENTFDFVVSNFVFCTVSTRQEIIKIMKSIRRVLRKNGSFFIMNTNWDKSNGQEFISFKLQYNKNLISGTPVSSVIKTEPPITLNDYYWSKEDYFELLAESGFEIHGISEPLAKGNHIPWIAEKSYPPYQIICSKKFSPKVRHHGLT